MRAALLGAAFSAALWISPAGAREPAPVPAPGTPPADSASAGPGQPASPASGAPAARGRPSTSVTVHGMPPPAVSVRFGEGETLDAQAQKTLLDARALIRAGKAEEGLQKMRDLVAAQPDKWVLVQVLGVSLEQLDRRDEATALYRSAADRMKDPGPALIELERLYRGSQDWDKALQTCLEIEERGGDRTAGWIQDEIESLVRSDRIGEAAIRSLEDALRRRQGDPRLQEMLITAMLFHGQGEKAMEEAADLDRSQKARGAILLRVASLAQEKRNFTTALDGFDRCLKADPTETVEGEALLRRAESLRGLSRTEESLTAFDRAAGEKTGEIRIRALSEKADMLARELHRPADALKSYDALRSELDASKDPGAPARRDEVRLSMADLQILMGHPSDAGAIYKELSESGADPETREEALYQTGEMLFYQGKLREAQDTWYALTDKYQGQPRLNDALERILLLGEASDEGGIPLTALAQAEYQRRVGQVEKALGLIQDALTQYPTSRAADNLLLERVSLLLDLGRTDEAHAAADTLSARFPDSPLGSRALFQVAESQARAPDSSAAQATYMQILLRYPDSLEAAKARSALQRIKERSKESSSGITRPPQKENEG